MGAGSSGVLDALRNVNIASGISYGIIGFTVLCLLGGFLSGLIRGFNRSLLRFILVVACAALAWFLRAVLVDTVLKIQIGGQTIEAKITELLSNGEMNMPEAMQDLIFVIVRIFGNVICFLVAFVALRAVTGAIVFPILKLVVKKGVKKRALFGGLVGLLQGVLVALVICIPVTGLMSQASTLVTTVSDIKLDGKPVISEELSGQIESLGFGEATESGLGKFYVSTGGGIYKKLTTVKDKDGVEISLESAVNAVKAAVEVANSLSENIDKISNSLNSGNGLDKEGREAIKDMLQTIGDAQSNELNDEGAQKIVNTVIQSVAGMVSGGSGEGVAEGESEIKIPEDFDIMEIETESAIGAVDAIGDYMDRANDDTLSDEEKQMKPEEVSAIVTGIAKNEPLISAIAKENGLLPELNEEDKTAIQDELSALKNNGEITAETEEQLKKLLGILPSGS